MVHPVHRCALAALLLNLQSGFAARTKVDHDTELEINWIDPSDARAREATWATDVDVNSRSTSNQESLDSPWSSLWSTLASGLMMGSTFFEALSVSFTVSCTVYSLWIFGFYGHDKHISMRLEVVDDHKQEFQKASDAFTGSTIRVLNTLSESVALVAERGFEGKRRHFLKLVRRLREHPERVGSSSCTPAFWQLITQWLAVFKECSLQQASALEEDADELPEGATVERVAEIACERMESMSASDIARQLESFMGPLTHQDVKALESAVKSGVFPMTLGCGERVRFTLISSSHAGLLFALVVGLALASVEIFTENWWIAAAVSCASACLLGEVLRYEKVDRMCRVETEVRRLRLQSCAAQRHHEQVNAFYKEVQAVTHLWLHRTTPQLEVFGELFDVLWGPNAGSTDASLLPSLAENLGRMRSSGLGPPEAWRGETAMAADRMQTIAGTLCTCADFIKGQQAEAKLERLPAIIHHVDQMKWPDASSEDAEEQICATAS